MNIVYPITLFSKKHNITFRIYQLHYNETGLGAAVLAEWMQRQNKDMHYPFFGFYLAVTV